MGQSGWPEDVVDQMRNDTRDQLRRNYALTINDAARYLGLSRYGIEKLVASGKLRSFTIAPSYRGQKAERRIPASDILAIS
jgi:excisionase family DNA binding protein